MRRRIRRVHTLGIEELKSKCYTNSGNYNAQWKRQFHDGYDRLCCDTGLTGTRLAVITLNLMERCLETKLSCGYVFGYLDQRNPRDLDTHIISIVIDSNAFAAPRRCYNPTQYQMQQLTGSSVSQSMP